MNKERILGVELTILAGLAALSNLAITGGAIGTLGTSGIYLSLIIIAVLVSGFVLILMGRRTPEREKDKKTP